MPKMESDKLLFPEARKAKGFGDLIKVIEGSPSRATLEALGMKITFAWMIEEGEKRSSQSRDQKKVANRPVQWTFRKSYLTL